MVQESEDGNNVDSVFVDFDRLPSTAMKLNDTVSFLLGQKVGRPPVSYLFVVVVQGEGGPPPPAAGPA